MFEQKCIKGTSEKRVTSTPGVEVTLLPGPSEKNDQAVDFWTIFSTIYLINSKEKEMPAYPPYIGITGFMSALEVAGVLPALPHDHPRQLMVGVLASSKTLAGQTNRWPNRYPKIEAIGGIFSPDPRCLNLIHYSTDEPETLPAQLDRLTALCSGEAGIHGPTNLHGFQLNCRWPEKAVIEQYRHLGLKGKDQVLILQIGSRAMEECNLDGTEIASRAGSYGDLIDGILLDASGGLGKPLDPDRCYQLLNDIICVSPHILRLAIAGGIFAKNLYQLFLPKFEGFQSSLSIDAEGRLRNNNDKLDLDEARAYVSTATHLFA